MNNIALVFLIICLLLILVFTFKPRKSKSRRRALRLKRKLKHTNIQTADKVLSAILNIIHKEKNSLPKVIAYLRKIDPFVFEELLLTCFERNNYKVVRNTRCTGDGGIDGRVYIKGKLYLIQAKRYAAYIKLAHLREFSSAIKLYKCSGGYFIHTGKTGDGCRNYLKCNPQIKLISGSKLVDFIELSSLQ